MNRQIEDFFCDISLVQSLLDIFILERYITYKYDYLVQQELYLVVIIEFLHLSLAVFAQNSQSLEKSAKVSLFADLGYVFFEDVGRY